MEHLVFEFRIYVELDAQESDVRPVGRRHYYARGPLPDPEPVDNSHWTSTAFDRVDDRTYPEDIPDWAQKR